MDTKKITLVILLFVLTSFANLAWAQDAKVVKFFPEKRLAVINKGLMHGMQKDTDMTIYRKINGEIEIIAQVKVAKSIEKFSIVRILVLNSDKDVAVGDFATTSMESMLDNPFEESTDFSATKTQKNVKESKGSMFAWSFIGLGILSGSTAGFMQYEYNKNYDNYKAATTPEDALNFRDKVENYENIRNITLIGAGVCTLTGVAILLLTKKQSSQYSENPYHQIPGLGKSVCMLPYVQPGKFGFGLTMHF